MLSFGIAAVIAATVVLCIGILVFLAIVGLRRYGPAISSRLATRACGEEKPEMEWDNSELSITVNPLDTEACGFEEISQLKVEDTCDVIKDVTSDVEDEERDVVKNSDGKELEWDDSVLSY